MNKLAVKEENVNKELNNEKLESYISILENTETELLYNASPEDIPELIHAKGLAMLSLISLGHPYISKNDLLTMVAKGKIYSIKLQYLLSLDESHSISIRDDNRIEDMLPSLYIHGTSIPDVCIAIDDKKQNADTSKANNTASPVIPPKENNNNKPKQPKEKINLKQAVLEEKGKAPVSEKKEEPTGNPDTCLKDAVQSDKNPEVLKETKAAAPPTKIATFDISDYCYNLFDLKILDKDNNPVIGSVTITCYRIEKTATRDNFVAIVDTTSNKGRGYKSVFFCLKGDESITVPINTSIKPCKIRISFGSIECLDKEFNVSYDIKKNKGKKCVPAWKSIYAFPYSIKEDSKGGVLVGKTKTGFETYQSDYKMGNISIKRKTPDGQSDIEFNVLLSYMEKKVILEMLN